MIHETKRNKEKLRLSAWVRGRPEFARHARGSRAIHLPSRPVDGFVLTQPARGAIPVLVECPHAGLLVPAELAHAIGGSVRSRMRDADLDVDRLCEDVPSVGATLLRATISRHVVDLNRDPDDIDPLLHAEFFARRGPPRGVVWRVSTDGRPVATRPLSHSEVVDRVERYHAPYHNTLAAELDRLKREFGRVVLLAVHSMPSTAHVPGQQAPVVRADVVPGTRGRTSAASVYIDCADALFRGAGLSIRHDDPYRGGFTTGHYGRPVDDVHAIQIELSRALYLEEVTLVRRDAGVASLRKLITTLSSELGAIACRGT